ncbi:hypothetical protein [Frankia sp. QA3]|uniref:hypothetical protein n=1 Tax=Frankia sp. QA3 TaxID=710111 RepID=UPI000269C8A0|nr:hypothetical protein [Frankia sp. QA3]EIV94596.1 hypothetical protein FraQA3DRAFT_4362 [Frankia sp. QA3]
MSINKPDTAAVASIGDVADRTARVDARVRAVLREVMARERSTDVAVDYVQALSAGGKANCWTLAETAGHEGWGRMQSLLGSYRSYVAIIPRDYQVTLPGDLRDASLKLLRFRLFDLPTRLTRGQRKRWLHLRADWPWIDAVLGSWTRVKALPAVT